MSLQIIGMPINHGADKIGCNLGPDKFRELNIISMLRQLGYIVEDLGDIEVAAVSDEYKYKYDKTLKYYDTVIDANTKLAFKVYDSIKEGNFPLILGGDHSLGIGSIAGISKHIKNIGVVWIDAHGDINTHETTPTGNLHGLPLAASVGLGPDKLVNLFEHRIKVKDENVVHIGGRDFDIGEVEIINNSKIKAYTMDKIKEYGLDMIIKESISYLKDRVDAIHVSFDIDSIDSRYISGIGTPVKDGLTIDEAKNILGAFAESGMMVSLDFVELNPALDKDDETAHISLELLTHLFKRLSFSFNNQFMLG